jgi:glycosyltransferase involved in cell wall biosynthesis
MPGYGEGFGIAYLEAIACGIPAIGSKLDGSREALLNGKLGLLVNPNHPSEIQTAIGKALKFPKATRPVGIEFYSKENFSVRVSEILKTL